VRRFPPGRSGPGQGELLEARGKARELEAALAEGNAARAELEGDLAGLEARKTALEAEKADLEAALEASEAGNAETRAELEAEIVELEAGIADLEAGIRGLEDDMADLEADKAALAGQVETLTGQKSALESQLAGAVADGAASEAEIAELEDAVAALDDKIRGLEDGIAELEGQAETLAGEKAALAGQVQTLSGQKSDLEKELAAANATNGELEAEIDDLDEELAELNTQIAPLQAALTTANETIALQGRQIDLMKAGGRFRDADWFEKSDGIAARAEAIGSELATVFLGDGLILEALATMDSGGDGETSEAEIKTGMANIPTARVHVAAMDGATVEEIIWGIKNGWLPQKTAYTIVHAGRAEVEANKTDLETGSVSLGEPIGKKIGSIYPALKAKTQAQGGNPTSVIFSGIIPATSIHEISTNSINGNNGIKSVVPAYDSYNIFVTFLKDNVVSSVDGIFQYNTIGTKVCE
jgi:predicted  nucleic acid-binding Zn-ribbon protein